MSLNQFSINPNCRWKVTTEPTIEPVTVAEVKIFGRIDGTSEDTLLESFIKTARQGAEAFLGRSLIEQTLTMEMDFWPGEIIDLPRPPLISITKIVAVDEDDIETEYSSSNYYIQTKGIRGQLILKNGVTWPLNDTRYYGGYRIVWKAGFGSTAADVPALIKDALKLWVTIMYEEREFSASPPPRVIALLNAYRIIHI